MFTMIDGEPVSLGDAYGYCFVPQIISMNAAPTALSPAGNLVDWESHPYLDTKDEAVEWLTERGLRGEVLRYAHHEPVDKRGSDYRPWVTAGVVAKVDGQFLDDVSPVYKEAVEWARDYGRRIRNAS